MYFFITESLIVLGLLVVYCAESELCIDSILPKFNKLLMRAMSARLP
jgi:hypothetical protein